MDTQRAGRRWHPKMGLVSAFLLLLCSAVALPARSAAEFAAGLEDRESCSLEPTNPSQYWYESINHNGISPFIPNGDTWPVYRNVKTSFGAMGDGVTDDSDAIQNALNAGNSFAARNSNSLGTTGQPAVIYLPSGTYVLKKPLQLFVGTVLMGNPINMPVLKAAADFNGQTIIYGKDPNQGSTTNFYVGIKNLIIDSQSFNKDTSLTLLDWSISQACQLSNVVFDMPYNSGGHTGLAMPEGGSPLMINDCTFHGGAVGISMDTQQYHLKGVKFDGCTTGIKIVHVFDLVVQGCEFTQCTVGILATDSNFGFLALIDTSASSVGTLVSMAASDDGQGSLVLENVQTSGVSNTVLAGGNQALTGSVAANQAWVWGNSYVPGGPGSGAHQRGTTYSTVRSSLLTDASGTFKIVTAPTYKEYDVTQFVNVKSVPGLPVAGDGVTDDTANLQQIIDQSAGCKILFFPQGTYLVSNTLFFPVGSRVFGEGWSAISATGAAFWNPSAPIPMVKVGQPGDVGVAQFSDMLFTVADVLQGCKLLEVNMAGANVGDVGFWNTHFRVGGAAGSKVHTNCNKSAAECKAAFMMAHLTSTSSAYIENMWQWTADHDLDVGNQPWPTISTGRGMLVEATKGTWLLGLGIEHNTLYQSNFDKAQNVFLGFQQSESPYWQGPGNTLTPAPWGPPLTLASDPDFSWCSGDDAQCRMALYQRISGSSQLSFYGAGLWTFFNNESLCTGDCQKNAVLIQDTNSLYYFGINTRAVSTLVRNNGNGLAISAQNTGGWGAGVAAFLTDSY